MSNILVIGGSNIDYLAKSISPLIKNDSNIGKISISNGGVGRNISCNLALLKNKVSFITGLGKDLLSINLKKELKKYRIKLLLPKTSYGVGSYVAINDNYGEMSVAICDNMFCDNLSYNDLIPFQKDISKHKDIVLDTNLNENIINDIINHNLDKRYYVDGVSANKVKRIKKVLNKIHVFKSNLIEAQELIDKKIDGVNLVKEILSFGVKNVVITNSAKDIYYGSDKGIFKTNSAKIDPKEIKNVNGAGDAFFSGFVSNYIENNDIEKAIIFAKKMSYFTLKSSSAINENIYNLIN